MTWYFRSRRAGTAVATFFSCATRLSRVLATRALFSVWWRMDSARVESRLISADWRDANLAFRASSAALASRYWEKVPLYSTSAPSSMCRTLVIDSSKSCMSWLTTRSAPL